MNPNYTEFKFPQIKAHPWNKVFSKRMPPDAVDLVSCKPHPNPFPCPVPSSLTCNFLIRQVSIRD